MSSSVLNTSRTSSYRPSALRTVLASVVGGVVIAAIAHVINVLVYFAANGFSSTQIAGISDFFNWSTFFGIILITVALAAGVYKRWWTAVLGLLAAAVIASFFGILVTASTQGVEMNGAAVVQLLAAIVGSNLILEIAVVIVGYTIGQRVFFWVLNVRTVAGSGDRVALVRLPASTLAEGVVTHQDRAPINTELADTQWENYVAALRAEGWDIAEVPVADDLADSVFIEDTAVIFEDLAVIANPGSEHRQGETEEVEDVLRERGLDIEHIIAPGTLDGGDVLKVGSTVYVGRGGRTNGEGIRQLRAIVADLGYTVVAVPTSKVLHLKSAVTALPDGTVIGDPALVDDITIFDRFLPVPEAEGGHVVVLGPDAVLMSAAAPKTALLLNDLGYRVVVVDISEFEKLEGCVTCLSIRIR